MRLYSIFLALAFTYCSGSDKPKPDETIQETKDAAPVSEPAAAGESQPPAAQEDELPHSKALEAQVSFENSEFGLKDSTPGRNYTARTTAKVRNGAGEHFPVVGMLPEGKKIYVIQIQEGWAQIGPDKWVSTKALAHPK